MKNKRKIFILIIRVFLIGLILTIIFFPLYYMFIGTFKVRGEFFSDPVIFFPPRFNIDAYRDAIQGTGGKGLIDSLVIASSSMVLSILFGLPVAHAIAQYKWAGGNFIFMLLVIQMLPPIAMILPLFLMYHKFGLLDTYIGIIIADTVFNLPYAIWLMVGFFEEIPIEIIEAAKVDGASNSRIFIKIALPLIKPGIMAVSFFTYIFAWNEFLLALIVGRNKVTPLTVVIPNMIQGEAIRWEQVYATSIIAIIPVIVFAFFMQRFLVRGLTFGSVKG